MGHYSCLFGRQLNLSSEHCTIAERVATHISHIAVGAFLPVSISPTPMSVSGSLRSQLSQISQCSTPVSLTSPKNHINQARSTKSKWDPVSAHFVKPQEILRPHSALSQSPSPLAASQVPLSQAAACTAVSGTSHHECFGTCERGLCVFD